MNKEDYDKFSSGYNEGFFYATQVVASEIIRCVVNHPSWMMPGDRDVAIAHIKLCTRQILEKRKLVPTAHQVRVGAAEEIKLDFNIE